MVETHRRGRGAGWWGSVRLCSRSSSSRVIVIARGGRGRGIEQTTGKKSAVQVKQRRRRLNFGIYRTKIVV